MSVNRVHTILSTLPLSALALGRVHSLFTIVHHYPNPPHGIPTDILPTIDVLFTIKDSLPPNLRLTDLPNLELLQLGSAGADGLLKSDFFMVHEEGGLQLATASGTHVLSIPNWVVGSVIALYNQLPAQILHARNYGSWVEREGFNLDEGSYYARKTFGRTAGMLGYGALGRETARLLKAHGMRIIAANTSGRPAREEGYIIPGTGDPHGSLPESYYSTKSPESLRAFLEQTDVLVCSLPSTPATRYMLDAGNLALLKPEALFINIGRGDLISSDSLLTALASGPSSLFGIAIDVTDPEPLPPGHPLFTHPRVIVTPHTSGDTEGEFDIATDILIENVTRMREGRGLVNQVNLERGY